MPTPPRLLGRDDEIRCLDGVISAAREGRGGALVLRGEAGIGKSALVRFVLSHDNLHAGRVPFASVVIT